MNASYYRISPAFVGLAAAALGLAMALAAILVALAQPQIDLPKHAVVLRLGNVELRPTDLMEEPDHLGSYKAIQGFNARQSLLRAQLDADTVEASYALPDASRASGTFPIRTRTLSDLPVVFWFQIAVGLISILIGGWVLGLRREDWGARMFALTTLFLPFSTNSAAIYSTRQIALDGDLFRTLSSINAFGSMAFGIALVGLFAQYPKPLFRPAWLVIPTVVFGAGIACNIAQVGPDNMIGLVILTEMLIATILGVLQWVKSRREPLNRAGLRWFILVSLIGCALFVMLSSAPVTLGLADEGLISQGYAFGFFNIMHIGLALGVMRYKVFNLDRWSYYIWLWLSGMILIVVLDLAVIRLLQTQPWVSMGLALLLAGFLYFPLRQILLKFLLLRHKASLSGRMADIIGTALSPTPREQAERWDKLLEKVFQPLSPVEKLDMKISAPRIDENGLALLIPSVDGISARRLRYAQKGRRLFSPEDIEIAANAVQTHDLAAESRRAYERGATLERDRISRDVHDNIGAQLLSALHSPEVSRKDDLLRDSLSDLRAIINDGFQAEFTLVPLLADLRTETAGRLEAHGVTLKWHSPDFAAGGCNGALPMIGPEGPVIPFVLVNGLRSILREAVSNILRHSQASTAEVSIDVDDSTITLTVADDGKGVDATTLGRGGNGIPNILERAEALAGHSVVGHAAAGKGTLITVMLPLSPDKARMRHVAQ